MLQLRRLTLGERISCVLECPESSCREKMDLDLNVSDLLLPPHPHQKETHETVVADEEERYRVGFRLPNGADQESAAALACEDIQAAVNLVLQRCVEKVTRDGEDEQPLDALPLVVSESLPQVMAELDPQAEILLNLTCPTCGASFVVPFDTADYFCRELSARGGDLYREVHLLAYHYHWSESEIMAMTRRKRSIYLGLLSEAWSRGETM